LRDKVRIRGSKLRQKERLKKTVSKKSVQLIYSRKNCSGLCAMNALFEKEEGGERFNWGGIRSGQDKGA
jgi:hypothetical protein